MNTRMKIQRVPVEYVTHLAHMVGPNEELTPMWSGYAMVMGRTIAQAYESDRHRTEKACLRALELAAREVIATETKSLRAFIESRP